MNNYAPSQIGNAGEMPLYLDVLYNYIVHDLRARYVVMKPCNERIQITIMVVLEDGIKFPP